MAPTDFPAAGEEKKRRRGSFLDHIEDEYIIHVTFLEGIALQKATLEAVVVMLLCMKGGGGWKEKGRCEKN